MDKFVRNPQQVAGLADLLLEEEPPKPAPVAPARNPQPQAQPRNNAPARNQPRSRSSSAQDSRLKKAVAALFVGAIGAGLWVSGIQSFGALMIDLDIFPWLFALPFVGIAFYAGATWVEWKFMPEWGNIAAYIRDNPVKFIVWAVVSGMDLLGCLTGAYRWVQSLTGKKLAFWTLSFPPDTTQTALAALVAAGLVAWAAEPLVKVAWDELKKILTGK